MHNLNESYAVEVLCWCHMNDQTPLGDAPSTPTIFAVKISALPTSLTTVTPLSRYFAMVVVVALPFVGFIVGIGYGQSMVVPIAVQTVSKPLPTSHDIVSDQNVVSTTTSTSSEEVPGSSGASSGSEPTSPDTSSPVPPLSQGTADCGITNCHGLDITCGSVSEPQACTMMYQVGDGCRQFASCGELDGSCQPILSKRFTDCRSCVQACEAKNRDNPIDVLACEETCVK